MKKTLSEYDFYREWETNEERKDQFSHGAQKALYNYLVEYEESTGEDVELDIIALCCDYTEYASAFDAYTEYADGLAELYEAQGVELPDCNTTTEEEREEEAEKLATEWLEERTTVIPFDYTVTLSDGIVIGDKGVIIAQF